MNNYPERDPLPVPWAVWTYNILAWVLRFALCAIIGFHVAVVIVMFQQKPLAGIIALVGIAVLFALIHYGVGFAYWLSRKAGKL